MGREPKRPTPSDKARNLLNRFPVTDLARAVARTGSRRRAFLADFVENFTTLTYVPTRDAASMIYGAQIPLFETPLDQWPAIEKFLRETSHPRVLEMNVEASDHLFKLVRPKHYVATKCDEQVLRVGLNQVVPIYLRFYITDGERVIFQFPQPRLDCLTGTESRILGSVIHHAYVIGDFALAGAEIEIAELGRAEGAKHPEPREPRIQLVPRDEIFDLAQLTDQIQDVYTILREIAARPPGKP